VQHHLYLMFKLSGKLVRHLTNGFAQMLLAKKPLPKRIWLNALHLEKRDDLQRVIAFKTLGPIQAQLMEQHLQWQSKLGMIRANTLTTLLVPQPQMTRRMKL